MTAPTPPQLFHWIADIPTAMVHHMHILVKDIESVKAAYDKGVPGVKSYDVHDVRKINGLLALMVRADPISVEYIQITDPEIGSARLMKDAPLGLYSVDLLVPDGDAAIAVAQKNGFILTGQMSIYNCQEIWMRHPELEIDIEFMVPPPAGYVQGSDPEAEKAWVRIYGNDGTEDLYFD